MITNIESNRHKIAFVIFAQNESSVIERTVINVKSIMRPMIDELYVIADNCSDNTAQLASAAGAHVISRGFMKPQGKGAALVWFMQFRQKEILEYDYIVVLDADSLIPEDFIQKLENKLSPDIEAAQCFLSPIDFEGLPLTTLIAFSDIIEQTIFDRIRSALGFSVRLRGTGMIFKPRILLALCPRIGTDVEDIALSLIFAEHNIVVKWFRSIIVFDPKPTEREAATRQRARWFRGQWAAFWNYRKIIANLIFKGPAGWSVLGSLFLKPRWLKLALLIMFGIFFIKHVLLSSIAFFLSGFELLIFIIGIFIIPNHRQFLLSLLSIPSFILMWVKSIILSLKNRPWLRVREFIAIKKTNDPNVLPLLNSKDLNIK
jgi:cellulose synthase/poly-beta-1,6-N-acetylglucosamine synthase-like glycosyltransferase